MLRTYNVCCDVVYKDSRDCVSVLGTRDSDPTAKALEKFDGNHESVNDACTSANQLQDARK